jgi:hypothetical protein
VKLKYPNKNEHLEWTNSNDLQSLQKYKNKLMIGFLSYSHYEVLGILTTYGSSKLEIRGYDCSHFRELTKDEISLFTNYSLSSNT